MGFDRIGDQYEIRTADRRLQGNDARGAGEIKLPRDMDVNHLDALDLYGLGIRPFFSKRARRFGHEQRVHARARRRIADSNLRQTGAGGSRWWELPTATSQQGQNKHKDSHSKHEDRHLPALPVSRLEHITSRREQLGQPLFQNRLGKFSRWHSDFGVLVFEMISHPVVILESQPVLRGLNTELVQPFGIDIEPARAILHDSPVPILAFSAEKPIDEDLRRVRMRGIFYNTQNTEAVARGQSFLGRWHRFYWQTGFDERFSLAPPYAECHGDPAFG